MEATPIKPHPLLPDTILIPNVGPRQGNMSSQGLGKQIVVGLQCGMAVLRGADVFAPGVMGAPKGTGDVYSAYLLIAVLFFFLFFPGRIQTLLRGTGC